MSEKTLSTIADAAQTTGAADPFHTIEDAVGELANGLRLLQVYMHERPAAGDTPDVDHIEFIRRGLERHVEDAEAALGELRQARAGKAA